MKQYQLPSWFWRVLTGFLIGGVLSYMLAMALGADLSFNADPVPPVVLTIVTPFFPPLAILFGVFSMIAEFVASREMDSLNAVLMFLFGSCLMLFYPSIFATLFYLGGRPQTRNTIVTEILIVLGVVTLGLVGAVALY